MHASRIRLCENGPEVSRFVVGYWRLMDWPLRGRALLDFAMRHLDIGLTTIDHADIYGNYNCEAVFGEALRLAPGLRQRLEIVTKCGICLRSTARPANTVKHYDTSRDHIVGQVERSLRNLGTDHIDILLIHRPDPLMDADDVAEAFTALRQAGKVRHFGVSNFLPHHFELLQSRLDFPLVTNQVELSPLQPTHLHDGTLDMCQRRRIVPMAWSCLGGGRLLSGDDPQARRVRAVLAEIAAELAGTRGAPSTEPSTKPSVEQIAYAWVLAHPARPLPIIGSGRIERLQAAVAAARLRLDRQQWFRIWQASAGHEVP